MKSTRSASAALISNGNQVTGSIGPTLSTGGGLLTFTGASYNAIPTLAEATTCVGCSEAPSPQNMQFDAGTFEFTAAVPESGTLALMGLGIAGLAAGRRLRRVR